MNVMLLYTTDRSDVYDLACALTKNQTEGTIVYNSGGEEGWDKGEYWRVETQDCIYLIQKRCF
jgi:hypothetical protein